MEQMQLSLLQKWCFGIFRCPVQPRSGSDCFWILPELPLCPLNWCGVLLCTASPQHSRQDWSRCAESRSELKAGGGEEKIIGTMRHIRSCKINQDFDFAGAPSCTLEMWGRSLLSNTSPPMGRTPQGILHSRSSTIPCK